ncbi:MAG: glycosyltransferase, partial [Synergistaceae bacterium]|nr:glycosyltransferase [Synergistaceae bacterium]
PDQTRPDQTSLLSQIPSVAVIMSTYNGEKYLSEQIDSILAQKDVHVELFIRDDGSTDNTRNIISDYAEHHRNIHVSYGTNVGFARSFIQELLVASGFEYYAFSDQDDFWLEDKLIKAVEAIKREEAMNISKIPVIWHSNLYVSDASLNIIRKTKLHTRVRSLESLIFRRSIPGCTTVMNSEARNLAGHKYISALISSRGHENCIFYILYLMGGKVICSPEAYIYYRQHSHNTIGSPITFKARIIREYKKLFKWQHGSEAGAAQKILQEYADELNPKARKTLTLIASHKDNWISRLRIVLSPKFRTGDFRLTVVGKIRALFGWL